MVFGLFLENPGHRRASSLVLWDLNSLCHDLESTGTKSVRASPLTLIKATTQQPSTMADQSQTAANKQSEPGPCKQGCGFFVSTIPTEFSFRANGNEREKLPIDTVIS